MLICSSGQYEMGWLLAVHVHVPHLNQSGSCLGTQIVISKTTHFQPRVFSITSSQLVRRGIPRLWQMFQLSMPTSGILTVRSVQNLSQSHTWHRSRPNETQWPFDAHHSLTSYIKCNQVGISTPDIPTLAVLCAARATFHIVMDD